MRKAMSIVDASFDYEDWLDNNDLRPLDVDDEVAKALSGRQLRQRREAARSRKRTAAIAVGAGAAALAVGAGARYQGHARRGVKLGGAAHDLGMVEGRRLRAQVGGAAVGVKIGVHDDVQRAKGGAKRAVSSVTGLRRRGKPSPAGTNQTVDVRSREAPVFHSAQTALSGSGRKRKNVAIARGRQMRVLDAGPRSHGRGGAPGRPRSHGEGSGPRMHPIVVGPEGASRQSPVPKRKKMPHFHPSHPKNAGRNKLVGLLPPTAKLPKARRSGKPPTR